MSTKRPRSPSPTADTEHETWTSSKIEDRSSIFQGYFSPTMPTKEMQSLSETKSSSHRMLAYRLPSSQRTLIGGKPTLETGTDDDGERYGGRHILKIMEEMRVEGVCMVARWYGGVMLGPARFAHIEECAGNAIREWRQGGDSEGVKRRRVEDEEMERVGLELELRDRDENIRVLRELLETKTRPMGEERKGNGRVIVQVDYSGMTLDRLRLLDKARDNTVAFLLKKIDEAEKKAAAEAEEDGSNKDRKVTGSPKDEVVEAIATNEKTKHSATEEKTDDPTTDIKTKDTTTNGDTEDASKDSGSKDGELEILQTQPRTDENTMTDDNVPLSEDQNMDEPDETKVEDPGLAKGGQAEDKYKDTTEEERA